MRVGLYRRLSSKELMFLNCGAREDSLRVLGLQRDQTKINPEYSLKGLMLKLQYFSHLSDSLEKTLMLGKIEGRRRRGATEDEMVGWHHLLNGYDFQHTLGDGEGQGSLVCCPSMGS